MFSPVFPGFFHKIPDFKKFAGEKLPYNPYNNYFFKGYFWNSGPAHNTTYVVTIYVHLANGADDLPLGADAEVLTLAEKVCGPPVSPVKVKKTDTLRKRKATATKAGTNKGKKESTPQKSVVQK